MKFRTMLLCSALTLPIGFATGALAQTAGAAGAGATTIEEVVVTARKREESLQSIPVAVSAISGENLSRQGIREPSDLTRTVPSLSITGMTTSTPTGAIIGLRGQVAADVLISLSQPVGLYEDTVNIPHPVGSNIAFFDVQRVEVLKGPQGTLYGRNTTGGAINIVTRGADYNGIHGFVYGEGGNFSDWKLAGAVNLPIIPDMLAGRIAYQHWNRDGFGKSAITGEKFGADRNDDIVRGSLKFDPIPTVSVIGKLEYLHAKRTDALFQTRALGGALGGLADEEWAFEGSQGGVPPSVLVANTHDLFTNYSNLHDFERLSGWHGVIDGSWDITEAVRLRSITGYHEFTDTRVFDLDALPLLGNHVGLGAGGAQPTSGTAVLGGHVIPVNVADTRPLKPDETSRQWTQEFNLSGNTFANHFSWLVGAFYSTDKGHANQTAGVYPVLLGAGGHPADFNFDELDNTVQSWALFTQNDIKLSDIFSITFGARYTEEKLGQRIAVFNYNTSAAPVANRFACTAGPNKGGAFATEDPCAQDQRAKFNGTSYLLSFNFQFTPDTLLYVKTARGFRGGALQVRAADLPAAAPEVATDYEIGLKSDFFGRRLRANLAVYNTNYDNKQETIIVADPVTQVTSTPIVNAASARIRGFEGEFTAVPVENLTLSASVTYLDSQYVSFPNALNQLNKVVNASGQTFYQNPAWKLNFGGRYVVKGVGPGDVGLQANWAWRSRIPTTILNANPGIPAALAESWRQPVGLLNASLDYTLADRGLTFSLFSTNLLDKKYQIQGLTLPFGFTGTTQEPRMWGVSVRKTFGNE